MTPPIAYRIRDWSRHFENNRTRQMDDLRWVPVPNKHDGEGFRTIMAEKDGIVIYGCWHLILQVASKCHPRGTLVRSDGTPHTPASLSLKTGWMRSKDFERALSFCSSAQVGWIEQLTESKPQDCLPGATRTSPERHPTSDEGKEGRKEENRNEPKGRAKPNNPVNNLEATSARRPASDSASVDLNLGSSEEVKRQFGDPRVNPVNLALAMTGESSNDRARGFLAKVRKTAGEVAFRQELVAFASEIASGEEPANRGSALTARMSKLLEASK